MMTTTHLSALPAAMEPGSKYGPGRNKVEKHFPPSWDTSSDGEAEHGPREFFNRHVKNNHTRSRSLPNCGYVGRWHAHIATTGGSHRYPQNTRQRTLVGGPP